MSAAVPSAPAFRPRLAPVRIAQAAGCSQGAEGCAERLLSLLDQMPAFMWTTDADLRITEVHGDAARLEGLTSVGQSVYERWGDADPIGAVALHERALGGTSVEDETTFDGRTLQSRLEPLRDDLGRVVGVIGVALDVTDRRRAEIEAEESSLRLSALVGRLPLVVYVKGADAPWRELESISPQIEDLLGYPVEQWLEDGALFERVIHPDDLARVAEAGWRLRETGEPVSLEYRMIAADGRTLHVHDETVLVERPDGTGYLQGVLLDMTRHRELEQQLRHAQEMHALGHFAGTIAHDFRNSLTVINGFAELVQRAAPPELGSYATEISAGVGRALELTDRLDAFSTIQSTAPRMIDLCRAVESFGRTVEPLLRSEIEVRVELPAGPVPVEADPLELDRVLLNLALNAQQAMEPGGTLTISVQATRRPGDGAVSAVIGVADTGAGMPESVRVRVFEPFFTTRGSSGGTGIGLATVREIVRGRGGQVEVSSEPGAGTRFDVYLPLASGQAPRSSTSQASAIG